MTDVPLYHDASSLRDGHATLFVHLQLFSDDSVHASHQQFILYTIPSVKSLWYPFSLLTIARLPLDASVPVRCTTSCAKTWTWVGRSLKSALPTSLRSGRRPRNGTSSGRPLTLHRIRCLTDPHTSLHRLSQQCPPDFDRLNRRTPFPGLESCS
jgi:hypothetical protein